MFSLQRLAAPLGLILVVLLLSSISRAEPLPRPAELWALGDWGGARNRLFDWGVDLQLVYVGESAYNLGGGTKQLVDYTGQVTVGATFDLERIFGFHDAVIQLSYTERHGRNLVDDAQLNTFQLVQEVYGRGQTTRLTQLWFEQKYFDGMVGWKVGRVSMGGDFAAFSCTFQNLTFCGSQPGNLVGGYIFNWPISQWGTRVKVKLDGFGYYQVGAYDQSPQYLGYANKLLPVFYNPSTGVLVPVEVAWEPTFGGGKLGGSYKIGAWYSSQAGYDAVLDVNGNPSALTGLPRALRRGMYGAYLSFEQQVTSHASENPNAGLRLFLNAVVGDAATSVTDNQVAAGFWYTGPFTSRPYDFIAFAAGTTHQNNRVTNIATLQNTLGLGPVPVKGSEYVFELDYNFVPVPGVSLRPNVQYIYSPGGSRVNKDVWVLGLKTLISF